MKMHRVVFAAAALLIGCYGVSPAEVRYSVTFSNGHGHRWDQNHGRSPYYAAYWPRYAPYYYGAPYRHRRPGYYYAPVVVEPTPVYIAPPAVLAPPPISMSGNYGADLATLHEKMSRLRGVLQHQSETGQITPDEHERFTLALEGIEHDEHARSYDRGGRLVAEDFYDLARRLDQVNSDMQIALAQ